MSKATKKKSLVDILYSLKRRLTFQETENMQLVAKVKDTKFVMWKFSRLTPFTFSFVSHIETDY
jgi:hypothetical protein